MIVVHIMWIHEHQNWTDFTWDTEAIASKLADIRHRQGRLLGRMAGLGFDFAPQASLDTLILDVMQSSAIEGEHLNLAEVRSSLARRLGIDIGGFIPASRDVDGIAELMLDATQNFMRPLTKDRLFAWHAALFPTGRSGMHKITTGDWRRPENDPMRVVSGAIGKEKIHYQAPSADRIEGEMQGFLAWFNGDETIDPVLKSAIAHMWFVNIHPFADGNGRIGRAIGDMALARADGSAHRFYSLSSQIMAERKHYYAQLEQQGQGTPDISKWLLWFLACLGRAIAGADTTLANVLFRADLKQKPLNDRQWQVINRMLDQDFVGYMHTAKYAKMAKCSTDTALRDMQNLLALGICIQNKAGGRSTSYRLARKLPPH